MAEKLSVRIALEGGEEIERQLADIGEAGKKAFADITKSAEQAGGFNNIKPEEVTAKLKDMGVTGVDSINKIKAAVQKAGKLEGLVQGIKTVEGALSILARAAPIAGVAIVSAMTAAAQATIAFAESVNKVNDQAIKLGVGVEQLDRFRAGLEQAGVSAESVAAILQSKLASEQGLQGLEAFIQSLERMPDSAARSKAAVEQFGAAGAELIRILQAGGRLTGFGGTQGLINAQDAQKATQLTQAINQLEAAYNRLSSVQAAPALTTGINVATQAVQQLGAQLEASPWSAFIAAAQSVSSPVGAVFTAIIGRLTATGTAAQTTGQKVQQTGLIFTQWGTVASQAGQQATVAVQGSGTAAQTAGQQVQGGVQIWTQWGTAASQAGGQAVKAVDDAARAASKPIPTTSWTDWANSAITAVDTILNKLRELLGLSQKATPLAGGGTVGGAPAMASGGLLGGRGTGTSDSNLAWLSRGEHIMPARAVSQPGVLAFLEELRRSGGDLSRVLNGMGRFALGGMVPRAIPAFAAGGLAGGGNNVTIQFPGLPAIGGLRASSSVVNELRQAAALAQVRSGGRKPSRYS